MILAELQVGDELVGPLREVHPEMEAS